MVSKTHDDEDLERRLKAAAVVEEKRRLVLYLPPALHQRLKEFCKARQLSMNAFGMIALETTMDRSEGSTNRKDTP